MVALTYTCTLPLYTGTICLSVLGAEILIYCGLDWSVLDRYSRYTFTPYMVVITVMVGIIDPYWDAEARNSIITATVLALGAFGLLVKIIIALARSQTDSEPILGNKHDLYY